MGAHGEGGEPVQAQVLGRQGRRGEGEGKLQLTVGMLTSRGSSGLVSRHLWAKERPRLPWALAASEVAPQAHAAAPSPEGVQAGPFAC